MRRACFLDRDGVINKAYVRQGKPYPPSSLEEFVFLPGVKEALLQIREKGFLNIVVTNQPDVARKIQSQEVVDAMHKKVLQELAIDDIFACYEVESSHSKWYKPKPGMLLAAAEKYGINLAQSYMVGDRWRDIGAGKAAGCKTVWIASNYEESLKDKPDFTCTDLQEAAQILCRD